MELLFIIASFLISALIILLVKSRGVAEVFSVISSFVAFIESVFIALKVSASGVYSPLALFSVDSLVSIIIFMVGFIGLAITVYSIQYLRQETAKNIIGLTRVRQYFIMLNLFLAAMFLAATASSPIFAWIAIEATTLSTAFLISFYNKPSAIEAAWKYLIINSVGLLLGFFGTILYFISVGLSGANGFVDWHLLMANAAHLNPLIAKVAFIFVLVGYGTKVGFVPMHSWLPDAHSKAPPPISALLSGVLLNVAFIIVLKFKLITDAVVGHAFSENLLIVFALMSIIVAAFIIFTQENYKRLMAYSSIENMGVLALGFGFGGLGIFAAILHMVYNATIKAAIFLSAGNIFLRYSSTKIAKVKGVFTALPITSVLLFSGFLAIMGVPPFGTFLTKVLILSAGIKDYPVVIAIVLLALILLFVGFLKHIVAMLFGKIPSGIKIGEENIWLIIPPFVLIVTALFLSFHIPAFLQTLINDVASRY